MSVRMFKTFFFQINPLNRTFLWLESFSSSASRKSPFYTFSLSLSLWNNFLKAAISSATYAPSGRGRRGSGWEPDEGPMGGLRRRSLHQQRLGGSLHDCARLRVREDKKWSFNADFLPLPSQSSSRALCLSPRRSCFLWRRDVSVTNCPPEKISHHAAGEWTPTCCNAPTKLTCF